MCEMKRIKSQDYFVSVDRSTENLFKSCICNFQRVWSTELTGDEIVTISKRMNPLIEADIDVLISETIALFDVDRADVQWDIMPDNDQLNVKLVATFCGMPFMFTVNLQLADQKTHYHTAILPLLLVIKNLHCQKEFLISCIRKKDQEIAEYKLDGAVLSRKTVETSSFDEHCLDDIGNDTFKSLCMMNPEDLVDASVLSYYNQIISKLQKAIPKSSNVTNNSVEVSKSQDVTEAKKDESDILKTDEQQIPIRRTKPPSNVCRNKLPVKKLKNL